MYGHQVKNLSLYQILVNECRVYGSAAAVAQELNALRNAEHEQQSETARTLLTAAVEKLSHGENTVLYDAAGVPSVMVRIPAMTCTEVLPNCTVPGLHPAFRCGTKRIREIWFSKYLNTVVDGHAASLPMARPCNVRNMVQAAQLVAEKGAGWQLVPFSLRAAITLKCLRDGKTPSGNTNIGHDYYHAEEIGAMTESGVDLTGSGPLAWTSNGRPEGIWDLVGNLNEWDCGLRLMNGELQVMDIESLLTPGADISSTSPLWHALDSQGNPAAPGAANTLHFDGCDGEVKLTLHVPVHHGLGNCAFRDITAESGIAEQPLKLLTLLPPQADLPAEAGWRWIATDGEALPLSGGAFRIMNHSGIFFLGLTKPHNVDYELSGVRTIYVAPDAMEEDNT